MPCRVMVVDDSELDLLHARIVLERLADPVEVLLGADALRAAGLAGGDLQQPQRVLLLLLLGALLPALVSASVATVLLAVPAGGTLGSVWLPWFEGSAVGAVGMLPLACQVLRESPASLRRHAADWRPRWPICAPAMIRCLRRLRCASAPRSTAAWHA